MPTTANVRYYMTHLCANRMHWCASQSGEYPIVASLRTGISTDGIVREMGWATMENTPVVTNKVVVALWYAEIARRWAAWDESRRQAEQARGGK